LSVVSQGNPNSFIVIDEVHEVAVEEDIVAYLIAGVIIQGCI
jgi:hypothetical protein